MINDTNLREVARRGIRLLGSYATREGAKRAVVKDWQRWLAEWGPSLGRPRGR